MQEYKFFKRKSFYFMIFFYIIGILYIVIPPDRLVAFTYITACVSIIILGILKLSFVDYRNYYKRDIILDIIEGSVDIVTGVICFNFGRDYYLVTLICGIIFALVPIIRICIEPNKFNQAFMDSLKFLAAIILLATNKHQPNWVCIIVGSIFIAFATLILGFKIKHLNEYKKGIRKNEQDS